MGPDVIVCVTPLPKSQYHWLTTTSAVEVSVSTNELPRQRSVGVIKKLPGGLFSTVICLVVSDAQPSVVTTERFTEWVPGGNR